MSKTQQGMPGESEPEGNGRAAPTRRVGNTEVLRVAALVIAMYLLVQLVWFAHLLLLVTFLGILFGLAVASGVDQLARFRGAKGHRAAASIVLAFFGLLVGFGTWLARRRFTTRASSSAAGSLTPSSAWRRG